MVQILILQNLLSDWVECELNTLFRNVTLKSFLSRHCVRIHGSHRCFTSPTLFTQFPSHLNLPKMLEYGLALPMDPSHLKIPMNSFPHTNQIHHGPSISGRTLNLLEYLLFLGGFYLVSFQHWIVSTNFKSILTPSV